MQERYVEEYQPGSCAEAWANRTNKTFLTGFGNVACTFSNGTASNGAERVCSRRFDNGAEMGRCAIGVLKRETDQVEPASQPNIITIPANTYM